MRLPGNVGNVQLFAIGDVHGRAGALERALERIAATERRAEHRHLVLLGDLIDRGPESLRALLLARDAGDLACVDQVSRLFGNHELLFLDAIDRPDRNFGLWTSNGGRALLKELGRPELVDEPIAATEFLTSELAQEISFIRGFSSHARVGDLLLVHAGIDPSIPIDQFLALPPGSHRVMPEHWAWIRSPFLYHEGGWDFDGKLVVVHGHTPGNFGRKLGPDALGLNFDLVETHRRINLDAGANQYDQVLLLECLGDEYRLELVQECPFDPAYDDPLGFGR